MTDTAVATVDAGALALGESTIASAETDITAYDGPAVNTAETETIALAAGDTLALTEITAQSSTSDGDGSEAGVVATTGGVAVGDDSVSLSTTETYAASTSSTDTAAGVAYSTASGGTYEAAGTEVTAQSSTSGGDGSGAGVVATTSGVADGDGAESLSVAETYATSTSSTDIAVGVAYSTASGGTDQSTDALVVLDGDNTTSQTVSFDSSDLSFTLATATATNSMDFSQSTEFTETTNVDVDLVSNVDVSGNTAQLTLDVEAVGDNSLATADTSVLTTDELSSISATAVSGVE